MYMGMTRRYRMPAMRSLGSFPHCSLRPVSSTKCSARYIFICMYIYILIYMYIYIYIYIYMCVCVCVCV